MPFTKELLNAIPGDNPAGENLWYNPVYDRIKEARREEDDILDSEHSKAADWNVVVKIATDALANKTKDLQLAAWLTEAWLKKEGYSGLRDGLVLLRGLVENFWDNLYPVAEDGDLELRVAPLDWIGSRFGNTVKFVPVAKNGYNWFDYKQSRAVGYDANAETDAKREAYQTAISEGKVSGEMWDEAFKATPKAFYKSALQLIEATIEALDALNDACQRKFADSSPSFGALRSVLEDEVGRTLKVLLQEKKKVDPDPEDIAAAAAAEETGADGGPPRRGMGFVAWDEDGAGAAPDAAAFEKAMQAVSRGNLQEAIRILTTAMNNERCGRRRFQRKTQIAQVCVETGHETIALPILEELAAEIDARKLEEWESPEVIARPLALLYRCFVKFEREVSERDKLYARICRLSPIEAFGCAS